MRILAVTIAVLALAACGAPARPPAAPAGVSAATFVEGVYRAHDPLTPDAPWEAARCHTVFSARLCGLIESDRKEAGGEVPRLDGDPLYDAQDFKISELRVLPDTEQGDRARVGVTFRNFDRVRTLSIAVVREEGSWRIDDITYIDEQPPESLSQYLTAPR